MGAVVSGSMVQPATPSADPVQPTPSRDPIGREVGTVTVRQPSWGLVVPAPVLVAVTQTWWEPGAAGTVRL